MDTIVFEKVWQDNELLELKISARSEFVTAYQKCYIQDTALEEIAEKICDYMKDYKQSCYLEFGHKSGNYSPAFSMCLMAADNSGHVKIEVDIEIDDNDTRTHRCCFYVNSELGLIEKLGYSLKKIIREEVGSKADLYC